MDKIKEYFASKRISNSLLGALSNPRWVKIKMDNPDAEDDDKKHFRIGSALDCLLTSNGTFEDEFKVIDVVRPYGYMAKFVENLPSGLTPGGDIELYREAYDKAGYKMKIERVIDSFWTNPTAVEYYNAIRSNEEGKSILSKDEYDVVIQCKEKILANAFTHKYFVNNDPDIELIHQLPIYFDYNKHECKALLDGVYINHKEKYIQPFDLKTIGKNIYDFPISFLQFGYYRQAAFYREALKKYVLVDRPKQDLSDIHKYKVKNFIFIVVESKLGSSYPAIIYETSNVDRHIGLNGGYKGEKYYKGIDELLEAYDYHNFTQQWDLPMEIFENEGRIKLDVFVDEKNKWEKHEGTFSENTEST